MRFGTAKDIITPTEPTMLACTGSYDKTYTEIHDDIFVRCIFMDDGKKKSVIMSFDLIFHDRTLNDEIEKYASEKYGIAPEAVIVTHTHSHTSPSTPSYNRYNPMSRNEKFEELLFDRAKLCLDRAVCTAFEGYIEYGSFDADFNISRRGKVNGKYKIHPNPDYECDKEFFVMAVRDISGRIRSILCNYPCHPVFYPTDHELSGEFPGRLSQLLECRYYGAVALYTQSTAGDVRPAPTVTIKEDGALGWSKLPFAEIDRFAASMLDVVCRFIDSGSMLSPKNTAETDTSIDIAADAFSIELEIDPKPISAFYDRLEYEKSKNMPGNANWENALHAINGGYCDMPLSVTLHCQTLRISNGLYVAAIGGEPCFGVKKAIKRAFEEKFGDAVKVLFIGYTDDCAYIVDDKILSEGGYEPECYIEYDLKGPFKLGLDEKYKDGYRESLGRL